VLRRARGVEALRDQEREQGCAAGPQHRRQHLALGWRRRAPAPGHDHAARNRERHSPEVLQHVETIREPLVGVRDQEAVQVVGLLGLEQQRRELQDRRHEIAAGDGPARGAPLEAAARECEQQVRGDRGEQRVQRDPDREQHLGVRGAERLREPGEAERGHQDARAVQRAPPPGEQSRGDERPTDQQVDGRDEPAVVLVVGPQVEAEAEQPEQQAADSQRHQEA
jgi:hypothetical protein